MSTLSTILTFARAQGQTDSNGLSDSKGIIFANARLNDFHRQLVNHGVDASQLQEAYCDAVVPTTSGNGTRLAYPANCLALKTIEVNYLDTQATNYLRAEQVDIANLPAGTSLSWLRANGSIQQPKFDDHGDWYEIFPEFTSTDNATQAIRLVYFLKPTEYTATGDTVSYPENLDEALLGFGITADYYNSLNKFTEGAAFEKKYQDRVTQYISSLGRGSQQPLQATGLQMTGWNY